MPPDSDRFYPPAREHLLLAPATVGPLQFTPGRGLEVKRAARRACP